MAGGEAVGTQLAGHAQQIGELRAHVAADARDRRAPGEVIVGEALDHFLAEGALMVEHVVGEAEPVGHAAGVADVVPGAAGALAPGRRAVVIELQGYADHLGAALCRKGRDDRAVDAA